MKSLLPDSLRSRGHLLSTVLLDMSPAERANLKLDAPLVVSPDGKIEPIEFVRRSKQSSSGPWIVPGLPRHRQFWENVQKAVEGGKSPEKAFLEFHVDDSDLAPPDGPTGVWDHESRFMRTRYNHTVLRNKPETLTPDLCQKFDILDIPSYWDRVRKGRLIPCLDRHVDAVLLRENPDCAATFHFDSHEINVSLGFRGTARLHSIPFQPGIGRHNWTDDGLQSYLQLIRFVSNLVIELLWNSDFEIINRRAAEAVIQHYYLLPWTSMIDVTLDVNVAKAFACYSAGASKALAPALYQIGLLNVGYYNEGAAGLHRLPFARPIAQKALSLFDLGRSMEDRYGIVIGVSEHVLHATPTGTTWDDFGGPKFELFGKTFDGMALSEDDKNCLKGLLFFPGEEKEALSILDTITNTVLATLESFGLEENMENRVAARVCDLRRELSF